MLGNMLVSGNIEVLEHWLQVDSLDLDSLLVLSKDHVDLSNLHISHIKILLSGKSGVVDGYCCNISLWNLLDAVSSESSIDI
jgi:hypothetical protein